MFSFSKTVEKVEENKNLQSVIEFENKNKSKDIKGNTESVQQEIKEKVKDEFIWVDGYTEIDKNEEIILNKEYKMNMGITSSLHDTILPEINIKYKIFKVKGLINKKNKDKYNYSAKSIIYVKEFKYQDLIEYINKDLKFIENEKEYNNCLDYDKLRREKYTKQMLKLGFTELFTNVLYDKIKKSVYNRYRDFVYNEYIDNSIVNFLNTARAYKEENLSNDMLIYLLLEELNQ